MADKDMEAARSRLAQALMNPNVMRDQMDFGQLISDSTPLDQNGLARFGPYSGQAPNAFRDRTEYQMPLDWFIQNYGPDVSKWPYNPGRAR